MATKRLLLVLSLCCLGGCYVPPVREAVDRTICSKVELPVDLEPREKAMADLPATSLAGPGMPVQFVAALQKDDIKVKGPNLVKRLTPSKEIPGSEAPDITLPPPPKTDKERKELEKAIDRQFQPLEPLPAPIEAAPGPDGQPLTLADLQKLALTHSPVLNQAVQDLENARGAALQARLYPNPLIGPAFQSMGPGGGPINGGNITSVIKSPGKIKLNFDAAQFDVKIAEFNLRRAESDLRSQVRQGYFAVLVARENLKVNGALVRLTDEVYKVLVDLMKGGQAGAYETMQVRVVALTTRTQQVQAHNRYLAAWKQLAATLGLPGMPLTEVSGRLDVSIPKYRYDEVLARVLAAHTDVAIAQLGIDKADKLVRIAQVQPLPDFNYSLSVMEDNSPGPGTPKVIATLTGGVAVPLFDRNQGAIHQAIAARGKAAEEPHRVRADLSSRLADAFERYENTRKTLNMYRADMLPNQIQAFRATVLRHYYGDPNAPNAPGYLDLVTAEQSLVTLVTSYIGVLHDQWFAVVDVAGLLQTPDLFQTDEFYPVAPLPDLDQLFSLECLHRCGPPVPPRWRKGDPTWPLFSPPELEKKAPLPRELTPPRPTQWKQLPPDSVQHQASPAGPRLAPPVVDPGETISQGSTIIAPSPARLTQPMLAPE
jgi:cobalt-zinc-cadmium efflux system outer membrane protein